jgi:hypothetical protein
MVPSLQTGNETNTGKTTVTSGSLELDEVDLEEELLPAQQVEDLKHL